MWEEGPTEVLPPEAPSSVSQWGLSRTSLLTAQFCEPMVWARVVPLYEVGYVNFHLFHLRSPKKSSCWIFTHIRSTRPNLKVFSKERVLLHCRQLPVLSRPCFKLVGDTEAMQQYPKWLRHDKSQFASRGLTICTAYDTLCPETLNSNDKKSPKKPFNGEKNVRNHQEEHQWRDPFPRTDRHAVDVECTEKQTKNKTNATIASQCIQFDDRNVGCKTKVKRMDPEDIKQLQWMPG